MKWTPQVDQDARRLLVPCRELAAKSGARTIRPGLAIDMDTGRPAHRPGSDRRLMLTAVLKRFDHTDLRMRPFLSAAAFSPDPVRSSWLPVSRKGHACRH